MKFKVGDYVYRNYSPVQCGRVVKVVSGKPYPRLPHHRPDVDYGCEPDTVHVRMLPRKAEKVVVMVDSEFAWSDFKELVRSTRRKADKHEATLRELIRIPVPRGETT